MSLIILEVIPSLICYILIVLNFNCATWFFIHGAQFLMMRKSCVDLPRHINSPRTANLISSLSHTHGSNNLSLHHSFDLMSSPIDYTFMKSLDNCVVIIINNPRSSKISIKFIMINNILAPHCFVLSSATFLPSPNTNLFLFCVVP